MTSVSSASSPAPSSSSSSLSAPYLTNPTPKPKLATPPPPPPPTIRKDRLYIGNLHPTVDEYTLLQIFQKHGKVAHLDFLFHKTGPAKGRPRGYAFLEYSDKEDALKALVALNDKPLRGRKLVVTFAHQAPMDHAAHSSKRFHTDTSRPTALSLLKTTKKPAATNDKIAAMEAKLAQMARPSTASSSTTSLPQSSSTTSLPDYAMDSLPDKPLPSLVKAAETAAPGLSIGASARMPKPHPQRLPGVKIGRT